MNGLKLGSSQLPQLSRPPLPLLTTTMLTNLWTPTSTHSSTPTTQPTVTLDSTPTEPTSPPSPPPPPEPRTLVSLPVPTVLELTPSSTPSTPLTNRPDFWLVTKPASEPNQPPELSQLDRQPQFSQLSQPSKSRPQLHLLQDSSLQETSSSTDSRPDSTLTFPPSK